MVILPFPELGGKSRYPGIAGSLQVIQVVQIKTAMVENKFKGRTEIRQKKIYIS